MSKWYIVGGLVLLGGFLWWRSRAASTGAPRTLDAGSRLQGPSALKAELAPSSQTLDVASGAQGIPLQPPKLTTQVGTLGPSSLRIRDVGFGGTGAFR